MNTLQINHALCYLEGKIKFLGTFAINQIPWGKVCSQPSAIVFNTAPSSEAGEHWIVLIHHGANLFEYFDSLAGQMEETIREMISGVIRRNIQRVQSDCSSTCGEFCILYIYVRLNDIDAEDFFACFSKYNLVSNDRVVFDLVSKSFEILPFDREYPVIFDKCVVQTAK